LRLNGLKSSIAVSALTLALLPAPPARAADKPTFQAKPADQYANKQTSEGVTIAAEAFLTDDQTKDPFGKLTPGATTSCGAGGHSQ